MLLKAMMAGATALMIFALTMVVYGIGIAAGFCSYSGQLIACVAIESVAVGAVIWIFYD